LALDFPDQKQDQQIAACGSSYRGPRLIQGFTGHATPVEQQKQSL
jgi:hypothetical protein